MPLRDHFHPPLSRSSRWDAIHGMWPGMIAVHLNRRLPPQYVAWPNIHLGFPLEIDVAAVEQETGNAFAEVAGAGPATATATAWSPPRPTLAVAGDRPETDEYEVRVQEANTGRLVAAIEIVSPSNKDRPDHRRAFATKCAVLAQQRVSVSIVDIVTERQANLYADVLEVLGQSDPSLGTVPPSIYATTFRWREVEPRRLSRFESWAYPLTVGQPLPTLPLWLDLDLAVPLELEATYEETCRSLRIA
jgi:hypothetical protein